MTRHSEQHSEAVIFGRETVVRYAVVEKAGDNCSTYAPGLAELPSDDRTPKQHPEAGRFGLGLRNRFLCKEDRLSVRFKTPFFSPA